MPKHLTWMWIVDTVLLPEQSTAMVAQAKYQILFYVCLHTFLNIYLNIIDARLILYQCTKITFLVFPSSSSISIWYSAPSLASPKSPTLAWCQLYMGTFVIYKFIQFFYIMPRPCRGWIFSIQTWSWSRHNFTFGPYLLQFVEVDLPFEISLPPPLVWNFFQNTYCTHFCIS